MNPMKLNEAQERTMQPVLMLEGITYLPHYVQVNRWCGPGTNEFTEPFTTEELISKGAVWGTYPLWPRRWTELLWTTQEILREMPTLPR